MPGKEAKNKRIGITLKIVAEILKFNEKHQKPKPLGMRSLSDVSLRSHISRDVADPPETSS